MSTFNKKNLILEAANHLFERFGYHKTSVNKIAERAMIGKGTIYYYFESKEDIFLELLKKEINCKLQEFNMRIREEDDPKKRLQCCLTTPYLIVKNSLLLQLALQFRSVIEQKLEQFKKDKIQDFSSMIKECLVYAESKTTLSPNMNISQFTEMFNRRAFDVFTHQEVDEITIEKFINDSNFLSVLLVDGIFFRGDLNEAV